MIVLVMLLGIIAAALLALYVHRSRQDRLVRKESGRIAASGGISAVETVVLGGVKQYILIQAEDVRKPVLLVLHGGPNLPIPGVSCRGVDYVSNLTSAELIRHFTLVFWDQRGTGKSYHRTIPEESINVEQLTADTVELTDWLRQRFGTEKIFLAGVSWGTILGLQAASRYPEKYAAYIGISQIINWAESDQAAYDWVLEKAKAAKHAKAVQELTALGYPPYRKNLKQWGLLRKWLMKFGGFIYQAPGMKHPGMASAVKTWLRSPDYRLSDMWNIFAHGMKLNYNNRMLQDFSRIDMCSAVAELTLPVCFFHGRHDRVLSAQQAEAFYNGLLARAGKSIEWMEQSAHVYCVADARRVEKQIIAFADKLAEKRTVDAAAEERMSS